MKKVISIILVALLCVSLCACGSLSNDATKRKFVDTATDCNFSTLWNEQVDNPARAQSYCGQIFKVSGYIEYINEDHATIVPLDTPFNSLDSATVRIEAYFPNEDMVILSKFAAINFVGKVEEISGNYHGVTITMKEAFYIDDIIEITGEVQQFLYNMDHGCTQMEVHTASQRRGDHLANLRATYYVKELGKLESHEQITVARVSVRPGNTVKLTAKMTFAGLRYTSYTSTIRDDHITFTIDEITSIEVIR